MRGKSIPVGGRRAVALVVVALQRWLVKGLVDSGK